MNTIDVYDGLLNTGWTEDAEGLRRGRALWTLLNDDGESAVSLSGGDGGEEWSVWFPPEVPASIVLGVAQAAADLDACPLS